MKVLDLNLLIITSWESTSSSFYVLWFLLLKWSLIFYQLFILLLATCYFWACTDNYCTLPRDSALYRQMKYWLHLNLRFQRSIAYRKLEMDFFWLRGIFQNRTMGFLRDGSWLEFSSINRTHSSLLRQVDNLIWIVW